MILRPESRESLKGQVILMAEKKGETSTKPSTVSVPCRDQQRPVKGLLEQIRLAAGAVEFYRHFLRACESHLKVFVSQSALYLFNLAITSAVETVGQPHNAAKAAHQLLIVRT